MVLGWNQMNDNSKKLYLSDNAENIFQYANHAPEWFDQFTCGVHYGFPPRSERRNAFANKNYELCKSNLESLVARLDNTDNPLSRAEKEYVMAIFENFWEVCANDKAKPKLALVKRRAFMSGDNSTGNYSDFENRVKQFMEEDEVSFEDVYRLNIGKTFFSDLGVQKSVDPKYIHIVSLPSL